MQCFQNSQSEFTSRKLDTMNDGMFVWILEWQTKRGSTTGGGWAMHHQHQRHDFVSESCINFIQRTYVCIKQSQSNKSNWITNIIGITSSIIIIASCIYMTTITTMRPLFTRISLAILFSFLSLLLLLGDKSVLAKDSGEWVSFIQGAAPLFVIHSLTRHHYTHRLT